tara:strand:+ start:1559 stop:2401 length:843 start_codon:yes stop_codon:yes gene_type:complete
MKLMDEYSALNQIKQLRKYNQVCSQLDIELLVLHILNIDKNRLFRDNPLLTKENLKELEALIERREKGEPIAYLTNNIGFWNLNLYVDDRVLVPRPETETLINEVLTKFDSKKRYVLDLGTGSGAIGLTLAKERPNWQVVCSDISFEALKVASKNMNLNSLEVFLVNSDWLSSFRDGQFDIIIANPPYISTTDLRVFSDGLKFEPIGALVSELDGLKDLKKIVESSSQMLVDDGYLFLEHGYDQSDMVFSFFNDFNFSCIRKYKDLNDDDRVCSGKLERC